ncbi:basic secretory family protein [Pseudoalteromonas aurantia]|uniref:PKD domain-containing protein n=1 Tax=Pseudoalteromonas aurantia 208 TaxID=1314867 RepID=A0ABR9EJA8_9GAMM|nr:basic secretory family protein [Pseudoalteromonas aurantia]MBE0371095.1 hypothetical protein [Pseudoalteromonas aurantia 208]
MQCKFIVVTALAGSIANHTVAKDTVLYDITEQSPFTTATQYETFIENEGVEQLFDVSLRSKFISKHARSWVSLAFDNKQQVLEYSLTSAADAPERDPKQWTLYGSNDAKVWQTLDSRDNINFAKRTQVKRFVVTNPGKFTFFKLDMAQQGTTAWGDSYLQLADFSLFAPTNLPVAQFEIEAPTTLINQPVDIVGKVQNTPATLNWLVPGAKIFSHGNKAKAYFSKPGRYSVTLISKNIYGESRVVQRNAIKVLDKSHPWLGYETPEVKVVIEDGESEGAKRLLRLFPDIKRTIDRVTRELAPLLYKNFVELPDFEQVTFTLKWMDTIAYRAGDDSNMEIAFSSKYITERLANKPDEVVKYELLGVLWHELTHGYQHFPKSIGYDDPQAHAFIEGVADLIRIQAGYHKTRKPKLSESYLGGYTNTGFFLHWLAPQYPDFTYRFNQTAIELNEWSFEKAIHVVTQENIEQLWAKYQSHLRSQLTIIE